MESLRQRFIPNIKKESIIKLLETNKRDDERGLLDFREIKAKLGIINNANGSAQVHLGNTIVTVGVKVEPGNPFPDEPDKGVLMVNSEFPPVASPDFEPGPPDENAIELARVVDRGIRESKFIKLEELAIIPGQKVWVIWVDIYVLNHDGNLIDASGIATILALMNTKIPKTTIEAGGIKLLDEKYPLPLRNPPIYMTYIKLNNKILLDPSLDEELISDTRLTLTITSDNMICAMQKGGKGTFTLEDIRTIIDNSIKLSPIIRERILKLAQGE
ncbi:MAG: exosome complex protein Rrp42 [Thermoprotei archaeon]